MAVHGALVAFNPQEEDWSEYSERLTFYFTANGITTDAKKRAILLSCCGPATFRLLRSLVLPSALDDFSFDDLVAKVKEHKEPQPSVIVRRFQFNTRRQHAGESIAEYVAVLRKAAEHGSFGNSLSEMLRDRLVCGITDTTVQKRLLAERELTLDKAISLAQSVEIAEKGAKDLRSPTDSTTELHKVSGGAGARSENKAGQVKDKPPICYRCGGKHLATKCRFATEECHSCGKRGHIAKVCRSKNSNAKKPNPGLSKPVHQVTEDSSEVEYTLFPMQSDNCKPLRTTMVVEGHDITMEVDTGAAVSLVSEDTVNNSPFLKCLPIQQTNVRLRTYTGQPVSVLGQLMVKVRHDEVQEIMPLQVVKGAGTTLLGRDWLQKFRLDWKTIFKLHNQLTLQEVLDSHKQVFSDKLGTLKDYKVKFYLEEQAKPQFLKARPLPLALREKVAEELDRLQTEGIIVPTRFSKWAAPIVPVVKGDGSIRICGDFKRTINKAAKTEIYPLPRIEELFACLSGGQTFTTLDLSHAYLQLELEEESQELVTINTPKGLYKYTRLPFGVASAPAIFQRTMESVLQGLPMVCVYIDDIIVSGKTPEEHLYNLNEVLQRLESAGLHLKQEKCSFCLPEVDYLGHTISAKGLKPSLAKVRAITEVSQPTNVTQLKAFLGLVNHYAKFLPDLATKLAPLYKLLRQDAKWEWLDQQEQSFQEVKQLLSTPNILVHFDDRKPIVVACDASPFGIGAVLSHILEDGTEHPVAYASRSLSPAERRYSQLDKEALAIVFSVEKFHRYIFGRKFLLYSDHKPLIHIFGESKSVPVMASARLQRWALTLSSYTYSIKHKSGKSQGNVDALSRLPLPEFPATTPVPAETIASIEQLSSVPLTAGKVKQQTDYDPVLCKVKQYTQHGWPDQLSNQDTELKPFFHRKSELSLEDGIVLWGSRVVIPTCLQAKVLEVLHSTHIGISRMKSLARQFVWWPKLDSEIENMVKSCSTCAVSGADPPPTVLHPWEWPKQPWCRIHVDYAGPLFGKMYLIIVDAHSKWMEVHITNGCTTAITIDKLQLSFASFGLPQVLVSDNGPVPSSKVS